MTAMARSCVQSILKLVNSVIAMVGLAMIMYSLWLIRAWQKSMGHLPFEDPDYSTTPWYVSLSFSGSLITLIAGSGKGPLPFLHLPLSDSLFHQKV